MRARCTPDRLRRHCRTLGLPFQRLQGDRVAIGCPLCFPFDGSQQVVLALDELGEWSGRCPGCDAFAAGLLDVVKLGLLARRLEVLT